MQKYAQNYSFNIYIDISGRTKETQYFGLIAINSNKMHNFLKHFEREFPRLLKRKIKGTKLNDNRLEKIMKFIDKEKVLFTSTYVSHDEKVTLKKLFPNKAFFYERLVGASYFRLLERVTKKKTSINYNITLCEDNQLDSKKAINSARFLLKSNKREAKLTSGLMRDIPELKFADFIASAHRKMEFKKLSKFKHYKNCPPKIDSRIITRVFEK